MRIKLIAAGTRLPQWINAGYDEFAKRLSRDIELELVEIPISRSTASNAVTERAREARLMSQAIPKGAYLVALEVRGQALTSEGLADFLSKRARDGRDVCFLIGGPEGIAPAISQSAHFQLSLSALTLPHAMARVVLAEALYRANSLLSGHPYHRA